ncbi:hypothetical protein ABIA39_006566 [Nocardia sp. GAS34]|uniref:hypothetical protein n=1 Tax=unclassified Nocardia TaxID=2637762 RepID=UPI003D229FA4
MTAVGSVAAVLAKSLPGNVTAPLLLAIGWAGWIVCALGVARLTWAAALLAIRSHRGESIEGMFGVLLGGVIAGSAGLIAGALYAPL